MAIQILPEICISPPPPSQNFVEPFSPFDNVHFAVGEDEDAFRPALLSPPPSIPMSIPRHLSPLPPSDAPVKGQGLERERFERLLKSSRERSAALGHKKSPDLRKELAVKSYKSKQMERRARFLLKVAEPPCPSAAYEPKTPPDSPAIFNYSLPSPGLVSPLAMYEYLEEECVTSQPWTEQVDFLLPKSAVQSKSNCPALTFKSGGVLPSLDEITARLSFKNLPGAHQATPRLPSFLQQKRGAIAEPETPATPTPITIGRLRMPGSRSRGSSPPPEQQIYEAPPSPVTPKLQVTTTVIPRMPRSTTTSLTESNLEAFSRSQLLKSVRRSSLALPVHTPVPTAPVEVRAVRRRSAPAELPARARSQFKHPILDLPGGF
ncbi:hypothetical protein BDM02DRAFT_3092649 [Thelephora ganbajun]|uniref:Uncharacterized protein n=1 Tax=Thelephora ganbajun TaxID=370292 RepID=A0ACB6ZML4_THEGA|nr:hypothetical protein BDM02DRAFT_3092649 [Thelephora ganbajun]